MLPKVLWVWQENRGCTRNRGETIFKRIHFSQEIDTLKTIIKYYNYFSLISCSFSIFYLSLSRSPFQPCGSVHLSTPAPSSSATSRVHLRPSSTGSPSRGGAEEHAARPMPTAGIWEQSWTGWQRADSQYLGTEQQHTTRDQVKYEHTYICFSIMPGVFPWNSIVLYWANHVFCALTLCLNSTFLAFSHFHWDI